MGISQDRKLSRRSEAQFQLDAWILFKTCLGTHIFDV